MKYEDFTTKDIYNKKIIGIQLCYDDELPNLLYLNFEDCILRLWDDGQDCCESRYMVCDDDLAYFVGARFLDIKIEDGPETISEKGECVKECQFMHVYTSKGVFVVANYNEHNGYYGGFDLEMDIEFQGENHGA